MVPVVAAAVTAEASAAGKAGLDSVGETVAAPAGMAAPLVGQVVEREELAARRKHPGM